MWLFYWLREVLFAECNFDWWVWGNVQMSELGIGWFDYHGEIRGCAVRMWIFEMGLWKNLVFLSLLRRICNGSSHGGNDLSCWLDFFIDICWEKVEQEQPVISAKFINHSSVCSLLELWWLVYFNKNKTDLTRLSSQEHARWFFSLCISFFHLHRYKIREILQHIFLLRP